MLRQRQHVQPLRAGNLCRTRTELAKATTGLLPTVFFHTLWRPEPMVASSKQAILAMSGVPPDVHPQFTRTSCGRKVGQWAKATASRTHYKRGTSESVFAGRVVSHHPPICFLATAPRHNLYETVRNSYRYPKAKPFRARLATEAMFLVFSKP